MKKSSKIPIIIYESLKKIKEICEPDFFPPILKTLNKSIQTLQQMIETNDFKHYRKEAKIYCDIFAFIYETIHSPNPPQIPQPSDLKRFDILQRLILNTFYLIFSQSTPGNYSKRKLTNLIIKSMSFIQYEISINSSNNPPNNEDFEFLVAKVSHACVTSISGGLYVHGPYFRKVVEFIYRAFAYSRKQETQDKVQSLIEDIIILLFNRRCEPPVLPQISDSEKSDNPIELLCSQIAKNLIYDSVLIRTFSEKLIPPGSYSTSIVDVDIFMLISYFSRASEIFIFNYYSMAFSLHFLITVLSIKSEFFNSPVFEVSLKRSISQSLLFSVLSRQDIFCRPSSDLLLIIYRTFSDKFTEQFQTILYDGLFTALCSPSYKAKVKALSFFANIISEKHFLPDIFANFDCRNNYKNVFQEIVEVVSQYAYPKQKHRNACNNLIKSLIEMMRDFLLEMPQLVVNSKEINNEKPNENSHLFELSLFNHYKLLMRGVSIFKESPEKGIKYFINNKIIEDNSPESVSNFLFSCQKLDKYQIAMFLTESTNFEYLNFFMKNYSFKDIKYFDDALRIFLLHLDLPNNETRIDILLTSFSNLYIHSNGRCIFSSADAIVSFTKKILSYQSFEQRLSIFQTYGLSSITQNENLLSTENFHDPNYTALPVPPFEKFVEMMNGINDGSNLPVDFLKQIHFNISVAPIILAPLNGENVKIIDSNIISNSNTSSSTRIESEKTINNSDLLPVDDQFDNSKNSSQSLNSKLTSSVFFLPFDTDMLVRRDRNIEWYSCKCNQTIAKKRFNLVGNDPFYRCQTSYVIKPMFECIWGTIHGSIIANIEVSNSDEEINYHINNLHTCIQIAAKSHAEEALVILMSSLATFAGLLNPIYQTNPNCRLTSKNVTCFKRLLSIATEEADYLAPVWHIFVEQLSLADLYKPNEYDSDVLDFIDNFFGSSPKFQLNSVISLINSMIAVCNKELREKPERRFYMLEKLVLVAQYNMKRKNEEWSQIWDIIGNNYLVSIIAIADSKNNLSLSKKIIDYIRYLTAFFLLIEEKESENNQYNFMLIFLNVFQDKCNEKTGIYLLESLFTIIKEKSIAIRSGWAMIFEILTLATSEPMTQSLVFNILTDLVNNKIVLENPKYVVYMISFIESYSRNVNTTSPIPFYSKICENLTLSFNKDNILYVKDSWIKLFKCLSRNSRVTKREIKRAVQDSYLSCLLILGKKYSKTASNNDSSFVQMMNSIWEYSITTSFEEMSFAELDKFLIKFDEKFIQKYLSLLGDNIKLVIKILILSVFKDGNESGRINKNSNTNVNADVAIQILLNLVSQDINQSSKEYVISLLSLTVKKVPTLSLDHARSYVYLINQFSKIFKNSKKNFIDIFTELGDIMINSSNSDAVKRNVVCALARESLIIEIMDSDLSLDQKAKIINETFMIYLNSGFTQSAESLAGSEWKRVICFSLEILNGMEDNSTFVAFFDIMAESILQMIESSSKQIRAQIGNAVERKLML